MRPPNQKRILREDLKGDRGWEGMVDPMNSFMEWVYQCLNKNVTFTDNVSCFVKELIYTTPVGYPTMDNVEFASTLKTKATSVFLMQAVERSTYTPAAGPVYVPWVEENGVIIIYPIKGLEAEKTYVIRLLVS